MSDTNIIDSSISPTQPSGTSSDFADQRGGIIDSSVGFSQEEEEQEVERTNIIDSSTNNLTVQDMQQLEKEERLNAEPDIPRRLEPLAPEGYTVKTSDDLTDEDRSSYIVGVPTARELYTADQYVAYLKKLEQEESAASAEAVTPTNTQEERAKLEEKAFLIRKEAEQVASEFFESTQNPNIRYLIPNKEISGRTKLVRMNHGDDDLTVMKVVDAEDYNAGRDENWNRVEKAWREVNTSNNQFNFAPLIQGWIDETYKNDSGIVNAISQTITKPVLTAMNTGVVRPISAFLTGVDLFVHGVQDVVEETAESLGGKKYSEAKSWGDVPREGLGSLFDFLEVSPLLGRPISSIKIAARLAEQKALRKTIAQNARVMRQEERPFNIYNIRSATEGARIARMEEVARLAEENADIAVDIAKELQTTLGVTNLVRRRRTRVGTDKDGNPTWKKNDKGEDVYTETVDYDALRDTGQRELDKLSVAADKAALERGRTTTVAGEQRSTLTADELAAIDNYDSQYDEFLRTALDVDLLKQYVAIASELRKTSPIPKGQTVNKWLFQTMSKADDIDTPEIRNLVDTVNKFGVDFPTFAAMVYANYSLAGRTLQTASPLGRLRKLTPSDARWAEQKLLYSQESAFLKGARRLENIRRGLMVSAFKTASRNAQSGVIRSGFEGLRNIVQAAIIEVGRGNSRKALRELKPVSWDTTNKISIPKNRLGERFEMPMPITMSEEWTRSFGAARYLLDRFDNPEHVQGFTKLLLGQSRYKTMNERFYQNYNEIQQNIDVPAPTTRLGKMANRILDEGEDLTWVLNTPNRWQEFVLRETHFTSDIIRLTKQEWDVDLVEELLRGRLDDFLNDAVDLRGNSKYSFYELMDEATNTALRATYAAPAETAIGRSLNQFVTKFFLTTLQPFPRFMITAMELVGNMVAGAPIAGLRMLRGQRSFKEGLSDRGMSRQIATNVVGVAQLAVAWQFLNSDFAGAVYDEAVIAGKKINLGPVFFLPQMLMIAEATKKVVNGEPVNITRQDALQTLTGSGFRPGQTVDAISKTLEDILSDDGLDWNRAGGYVTGQLIGEIGASFLQPLTMSVDLSKAMQAEPDLAFKDFKPDPNYAFWDAFSKGFNKPFKVKGFGWYDQKELKATIDTLLERVDDVNDPDEVQTIMDEIAQLENERIYDRVSPSRQEPARRGSPLLNFLGFTTVDEDTPQQFFLKDMGLEDYIIGGTTGVGTIDAQVNEYLNDYIPELVTDMMVEKEQQGYTERETKAILQERLADLRTMMQGEFIKTKPVVAEYFKFRRFKDATKDAAREQFRARQNRKSNLGSLEDLIELNVIAKQYEELGFK
tara:strand:- start:41 stop:4051 length:4011 start_codon:yes stop_codon:yes gene_type:complete